jgi:HEAT repeat protein
MRRVSVYVAGGLAALSLTGCGGLSDCKQDGAQCAELLNKNADKCAVAYQLRTTDEKRKRCENAVEVVVEQKAAAALPGLLAILAVPESSTPEDRHRLEAAKALGALGDPGAVEGLLAAVDLTAGTSSDPKDKNANRTNEEVATALGRLRDKRAVPKLLELMEQSRDNYVVLKAVRALGEIADGSAVAPLAKIATEHANKFMRKNAIVALGEIGDLAATDALVQMMFVEYQGVSFYREASFALYQLGPGVADALMRTMAGENAAVNAWFEKTGGVKDTAIKAKCGFVLGDLRDARAVEPLMQAFKGAKEKNDPVVLTYAAPPLGALGDARAVPLLSAEMVTLDASIRDPMMRALNQLGDRSVVPGMIEAMTADHFVNKCVKDGLAERDACAADKPSLHGAQKAAADQASNLAGAEHLEAFKKAVEGEKDEAMKTYFTARLKRVEAAAECQADAACWAKKLTDADPLVREKAAWELGRLKDASTVDALGKALADPKSEARAAAIMAYWAFGDARVVPAIEQQLRDEESKADYVRVNEDLRRLLVHLRRLKA